MLKDNEKERIEEYIDKIIKNIKENSEKYLKKGMSEKDVIDKVVSYTVNKMIPESKTLLSYVYNTMLERTFSKQIYKNEYNKAEFYHMNIFNELNDKFNFEIEQNINYKKEINKYMKIGAIIVIGSLISIPLHNPIPIGIAVVIAGIMVFTLDNRHNSKNNISYTIDEYLQNVKKALLNWINSIEKYYDEKVDEFEKGLKNNEK